MGGRTTQSSLEVFTPKPSLICILQGLGTLTLHYLPSSIPPYLLPLSMTESKHTGRSKAHQTTELVLPPDSNNICTWIFTPSGLKALGAVPALEFGRAGRRGWEEAGLHAWPPAALWVGGSQAGPRGKWLLDPGPYFCQAGDEWAQGPDGRIKSLWQPHSSCKLWGEKCLLRARAREVQLISNVTGPVTFAWGENHGQMAGSEGVCLWSRDWWMRRSGFPSQVFRMKIPSVRDEWKAHVRQP